MKVSDVILREDLYPRIEPNATQIQQYAENLEVIFLDNTALLKSKDVAIGVFKNNYFKTMHNWQIEVINKWLNVGFKNPKTEKQLQKEITDKLVEKGWKVENEKYVSKSRIDIYATKNNQEIIIETKVNSGSNSICHAVGQLLFYKCFYPNAKLYISSINKIQNNIKKFLTVNKIEIWKQQ